MSQPTPPPSPQPALKLKVPGAPAVGATSGGPKLKVTTSPFAGPGTPPPPSPPIAPVSPVPPPTLSSSVTPPMPSPGVAPVPATPTTTPASPPAPPVSSLPDQPSESPEDVPATNSTKKKDKKGASTNTASKAKPSILFLLFDLLIFSGSIGLIVLILLNY